MGHRFKHTWRIRVCLNRLRCPYGYNERPISNSRANDGYRRAGAIFRPSLVYSYSYYYANALSVLKTETYEIDTKAIGLQPDQMWWHPLLVKNDWRNARLVENSQRRAVKRMTLRPS